MGVYEAANTLLSLTPLDSAVNKALESYTRLLQQESDQNVKLIVINRLNSLRIRYERNLKNVIMDILRGLSTPNIDVRRHILTLILSLASSSNIGDIINCLKKEIISINNIISQSIETDATDSSHNIEYRNLLVETIHSMAVKFPKVASNVVHLLMNYLGDDDPIIASASNATSNAMGPNADHSMMDDDDDDNKHHKHSKPSSFKDSQNKIGKSNKAHHSAAYDVILFVKEIVEEYPDLTASILEKLLDSFDEIRNETVYRVALWIFGEYCQSKEMISKIIDKICESLGELPLIDKNIMNESKSKGDDSKDDEQSTDDSSTSKNKHQQQQQHYMTRTVVLPDGTYAQSTMAMTNKIEQDLDINNESLAKSHHLRKLLKSGEYFFAAVLSVTLLKLILKFKVFAANDRVNNNKLTAKCLLIITSIIRYGTSSHTKNKIDNDTKDRMMYVINKLFNISKITSVERKVLLNECRNNFGKMLVDKRKDEDLKKKEKKEKHLMGTVPFDKMLSIRQLKGLEFSQFDEDDTLNLMKAVGNRVLDENSLRTRLSRIHQLTGFSDPIYAEAAVTVHQFDIVLDFLIINNTSTTLQNLNLELHTSGDLKIVEKPNKMTLAPKQSKRIEASIKVSSTENGVIFGNIVYDTTGATSDKNIVVMNCIHMDIMDYVHPEFCSQSKFREMWVEFEWENKVPVNTDIDNLNTYIEHIASITNMQLLTQNNSPSSRCQFLAANLHAKSIFGEHALMNVSIELKAENDGSNEQETEMKVSGHIRIRCKSQGIALSLGEKITNGQRTV